ncbi:MAG TPA: 1-phosphofructokinase family hexose kinase [Bryobacteraceae bacterium]|nr:1-phosphofructokinase family hexose kinase [Bryobacteraceae bacterium]
MIVTLTLNPAIDHNVLTDRLVFDDRGYILSTQESAGGRGINASRVIHSFQGETLAIAPSGGKSGKRFESLLSCCGHPFRPVPIQHEIRTNLTITDEQGLTVKLNERGAPMTKEELERIEQVVLEALDGAEWLMICGSVPPGVEPEFYSKLIQKANAMSVKTLLDTDGDSLYEGVMAKPWVVTPNQQEAERLLATALLTRNHFFDAARRLLGMGSKAVVLSLGSRGAVASADGKMFEVIPPRIDVVCPIGAGDALAAAFTWAMANGSSFADAVRWGVAAGTASARLPGLNFASLEQARQDYAQVEVREVS